MVNTPNESGWMNISKGPTLEDLLLALDSKITLWFTDEKSGRKIPVIIDDLKQVDRIGVVRYEIHGTSGKSSKVHIFYTIQEPCSRGLYEITN